MEDRDGEERRQSFLSGLTIALVPFLTACCTEAAVRERDETEDFIEGVDEGSEAAGWFHLAMSKGTGPGPTAWSSQVPGILSKAAAAEFKSLLPRYTRFGVRTS